MGFSKMHSSLVSLILNQSTGSISPQFHVVFDDLFSTVHANESETPREWSKLISMPSARFQIAVEESAELAVDVLIYIDVITNPGFYTCSMIR